MQVILFEIFALFLTIPIYSFMLKRPSSEALFIVIGVTVFEMVWGMLHDWVFDRTEQHLTRRTADLRPTVWRCCHALTREASLVVVSVPLIMVISQVGFKTALVLDLAIAATFVVYTFAFFRIYDWLRPLQTKTVLHPTHRIR